MTRAVNNIESFEQFKVAILTEHKSPKLRITEDVRQVGRFASPDGRAARQWTGDAELMTFYADELAEIGEVFERHVDATQQHLSLEAYCDVGDRHEITRYSLLFPSGRLIDVSIDAGQENEFFDPAPFLVVLRRHLKYPPMAMMSTYLDQLIAEYKELDKFYFLLHAHPEQERFYKQIASWMQEVRYAMDCVDCDMHTIRTLQRDEQPDCECRSCLRARRESGDWTE